MTDSVELRCHTLHGIIKNGVLEVKCRHIVCTQGRSKNVFHYFDLNTGELVETKEYKEPTSTMKGYRRR